ncbi:hypothetical protein [Streptomyces sp. NPDC046832]|uniref:hypothetical protein n=1 Tax=Streptomyces sp. NPDC046832 TaxID=3155020 RepID=UPI0033EF6AB7
MSQEFKKGERFFRVLPGRYPFRESEVRVQLREKTRCGSALLDEMAGWVDDVNVDPVRVVAGLKNAILDRRARDSAVRDLMGDSPV